MGQTGHLGRKATTVYQSEGFTCVRYHATDVVRFNERQIVLNSGGWRTATTKRRMNQASNQFDLGFRVWQKDFGWFVDYKGETLDFEDYMILIR